MKCKAIKIRHFDFVGKDGKEVKSGTFLVLLGGIYPIQINSKLAYDLENLSETVVDVEINSKGQLSITSISGK